MEPKSITVAILKFESTVLSLSVAYKNRFVICQQIMYPCEIKSYTLNFSDLSFVFAFCVNQDLITFVTLQTYGFVHGIKPYLFNAYFMKVRFRFVCTVIY